MRKGLIGFSVLSILLIQTGWVVAGEKEDHICFRRIDADRDGKVTPKEFAVHFGEDAAKFKALDSNEDGLLTHKEYHDYLGHGAAGQEDEKAHRDRP